jgi:hypothetical protein
MVGLLSGHVLLSEAVGTADVLALVLILTAIAIVLFPRRAMQARL